jgi:predicted methyltransferase
MAAMTQPAVFSYVQVRPILAARQAGSATARASLDLGLTGVEIRLEPDRITLPGGQWLPWSDVEAIGSDEAVCYVIEGNAAHKVHRFSERLNRFYSLKPTEKAPTLLVSGIPMHRIKDIDPRQDTVRKVQTIQPLTGRILDTCTGLGYTAIEAARTAEDVLTVELDPLVLEVARLNPWSGELFRQPNIRQVIGDIFDEIDAFEEAAFSRILHDPPTFSLAGDLYATEFYRELHRVLRPKGRVFHYIGDPDSRSGANVTRGVIRRLQEAGFARVVRRPRAHGVVAYKG